MKNENPLRRVFCYCGDNSIKSRLCIGENINVLLMIQFELFV